MARTYEAMKRKKLTQGKSDRRHIEFTSKKQIGDLERRIYFFEQKNGHRVFNFTSSRSKEGVSTVIINLVKYMSDKKSTPKLLLIDANFSNPVLHSMLGVDNAAGLSDCLTGGKNPMETIVEIPGSSTSLLSAGQRFIELNGTMDQEKLCGLVEKLKDRYDTILIDSPPLLTSSDSLPVATVSDMTFFTIQALKTTSAVAQRALSILAENECKVGGSILNRVQRVIPEWMYKLL